MLKVCRARAGINRQSLWRIYVQNPFFFSSIVRHPILSLHQSLDLLFSPALARRAVNNPLLLLFLHIWSSITFPRQARSGPGIADL